MPIQHALREDEIDRCFPVMAQLRPSLCHETFVAQVLRQIQAGYQMVFLEVDKEVVAVAGFRILENLAWSQFLYIDDLVTVERHRSTGYGQQVFDWLLTEARRNGCEQVHLDSGVQRFAAHRFYLRNRMRISSHHFALDLTAQ